MYDKVPNNMNFVEREVQVEKYWKDNDIFGKSIKAREGAPVFTFYDGPPTANGKPHIRSHHHPCGKGLNSPLQNHEGLQGSEKGRLGYTRFAC